MRRGVKDKISIILIIIIGIFTIFSYVFDQMVIRKEDDLRINQIKFENINTKLSRLNSISNQLYSTYETTLRKNINLKRYKNYWLKSILLITNYDDITPNLKDKEIISTFNYDPEYLEDLIKSRNIEHFREIIYAINSHTEKLYNIYSWNIDFFPQYLDEGIYNGPEIEFTKTFEENKIIFYEKDFQNYVDVVVSNNKKEEAIKNYQIKNWIDLNKYSSLLMKKLDDLSFSTLDDSYLIDDIILKNEKLRFQVMEDLKRISSKKNYFILASIISQIISLLFLLILFRNLIKN